jgi:hypothetical protein
MELAMAKATINVEKIKPSLFMKILSVRSGFGVQRTSRSRERAALSKLREAGLLAGAVLGGSDGAGVGVVAAPVGPVICMILSKGKYSRLLPDLESTKTLVTLL